MSIDANLAIVMVKEPAHFTHVLPVTGASSSGPDWKCWVPISADLGAWYASNWVVGMKLKETWQNIDMGRTRHGCWRVRISRRDLCILCHHEWRERSKMTDVPA